MHPCRLQKRGPEGYPIDFWGSFSRFLRFMAVLSCQVRLGKCFGPLLGRSWSRLGAVLGLKMDQVTPKLPPKPNPIGVLGRLEGSLERPKGVLGASWERLGASRRAQRVPEDSPGRQKERPGAPDSAPRRPKLTQSRVRERKNRVFVAQLVKKSQLGTSFQQLPSTLSLIFIVFRGRTMH